MLRVEGQKVEAEMSQNTVDGSDSEDMDGEDGYKMSEVYNTVGSISGVVSTNQNSTNSVNYFEKLLKLTEENGLALLSNRIKQIMDKYQNIMDLIASNIN